MQKYLGSLLLTLSHNFLYLLLLQLTKMQAANRSASESAEQEFLSTTHEISPGTEWERVAKLCDFNPKTGRTPSKDVGRMRSVILQLKQASNNTSAPQI